MTKFDKIVMVFGIVALVLTLACGGACGVVTYKTFVRTDGWGNMKDWVSGIVDDFKDNIKFEFSGIKVDTNDNFIVDETGINIEDGDDKVVIDENGIHVEDSDGDTVDIGMGGIRIVEG